MKQLESLDAYRTAQDLAVRAYRLTQSGPLTKHFALIDQIRRASISIPANIAEGYALGTTLQFMRCLRIALGSTAELRSHLDLTKRAELAEAGELDVVIDLTMREIAILVGLLKKLDRNHRTRFPFPVSRFPIKPQQAIPSPHSSKQRHL
ncbi:MAG: four helix bundle protein [Gemmatimonadales bacterium]